jgi:hypothetical protein
MQELKLDIAYVLHYLCDDWYHIKHIQNQTKICIKGKGFTFLIHDCKYNNIWITQERKLSIYGDVLSFEERKSSISLLLVYYKIFTYGR